MHNGYIRNRYQRRMDLPGLTGPKGHRRIGELPLRRAYRSPRSEGCQIELEVIIP